ncbi:9298_t:CDS:2, partial [Cetraspora pellucida]
SVIPGTYDVVWRLKIESHRWAIQNLNFCTTVIERLEDEIDAETAIHDKQHYSHIPQPTMYANLASKNEWVEYRLPYKIVVPERKIVDGRMVYHDVHLKIYHHSGY